MAPNLLWALLCLFFMTFSVQSVFAPLPIRLVLAQLDYIHLTFKHGVQTIMEWTPEKFSFLSQNALSHKASFSHLMEFSKNNSLFTVYAPLTIKETQMKFNVLRMNNLTTWLLYTLDTFDAGEETYWNETRISICGKSTDLFLGGHCKIGFGTTLKRIFDDLPPHDYVRITARVHFFDKWLGESIIASIDGKPCWTKSYHWCDEVITAQCMKHGLDICGNVFPDRLSDKLDVVLPHTSNTLTLEFLSTLTDKRHPCEVAWGVDDVAIYLKT